MADPGYDLQPVDGDPFVAPPPQYDYEPVTGDPFTLPKSEGLSKYYDTYSKFGALPLDKRQDVRNQIEADDLLMPRERSVLHERLNDVATTGKVLPQDEFSELPYEPQQIGEATAHAAAKSAVTGVGSVISGVGSEIGASANA